MIDAAVGPPVFAECKHEVTSLTKRFSASHWHCARQCEKCGQQVGSFVKRDAAAAESGKRLEDMTGFDEGAGERYFAEQRRHWESVADKILSKREQENEQWWRWYNEYLNSDRWRAKAALVRERSRGLCEGCRNARCTQVHHLSYQHVGDEFLWELVAICDACHDRAHAEKS